MMRNAQYKMGDGSILNYYEIGTAKDKLLLLHAQGTNSLSFNHVIAKLRMVPGVIDVERSVG